MRLLKSAHIVMLFMINRLMYVSYSTLVHSEGIMDV